MKNQTASVCLPSEHLAIIPFNKNNILTNHPNYDEETGEISSSRNSFLSFRFSNLMGEFQRHYTTEQFITTIFLWVMATTGTCHSVLGFELLEKTGLSNSISPLFMSFSKYSFAIFTSYSMASADAYCRSFKTTSVVRKRRYFGMWLALPLAHFLTPISEKYLWIVYYSSGVLYVAWIGGFSGHEKHVNFGLYCLLQTIVYPIGVRRSMSSNSLHVISILTSFRATSCDIELLTSSAPSLVCFLDKRVLKLLPVAMTRLRSTLKERRKIGKFVKYAIGLCGTLLFQNFFRLTTFGEVKAFLYLTTSWLANLTLINASHDFGILNFLLGNMMLGSTVSRYGLGITTWFTFSICLFLYILSLRLDCYIS